MKNLVLRRRCEILRYAQDDTKVALLGQSYPEQLGDTASLVPDYVFLREKVSWQYRK